MLHIKCAGTQMLWESSTLCNIRQKMILKICNSFSCPEDIPSVTEQNWSWKCMVTI